MARSHIELQNTAERLLAAAGIQPCFKPAVQKILGVLGLKAVPALHLQDGVLSTILIHGNERDASMNKESNVISVNANKAEKEQRFALAYQIATYALHKDDPERYERNLISVDLDNLDDDAFRLAGALLMDESLFIDKFRKVMKGLPNPVVVCKTLGAQFGVPQYAVEQRVKELELTFRG